MEGQKIKLMYGHNLPTNTTARPLTEPKSKSKGLTYNFIESYADIWVEKHRT